MIFSRTLSIKTGAENDPGELRLTLLKVWCSKYIPASLSGEYGYGRVVPLNHSEGQVD